VLLQISAETRRPAPVPEAVAMLHCTLWLLDCLELLLASAKAWLTARQQQQQAPTSSGEGRTLMQAAHPQPLIHRAGSTPPAAHPQSRQHTPSRTSAAGP